MVKRELRPKPLLDEASLHAFFVDHGVKPVHMGRIWKQVVENPNLPLDEIPGIPEKIRAPLKEEFVVCTSTLITSYESKIDGTVKMLIRLQDGGEVEAVLIHHKGEAEDPEQRQADRCGQRDTLCISSQVGCRLGCTFCATGTMGLQGNLWAGEIQEQLLHARAIRPVSNIVFMGMGEPLENFSNVTSAIRGLVDPHRFGVAPSGITVSTVGIVGNMRRLMDEMPKIKLAVSLHAPTQDLREKLLPVAKTYRMDELLEVIDEYAERTTSDGKRKGMVMISYVLLEDVNDSLECAQQLRDLLAGKPVIVNLIPFNSYEGDPHNYRTPSAERIDAFLRVLMEADIRVFERRHHGRDISAACGQLAKLGGRGPVADIENCTCTLAKDKARGLAQVPSSNCSNGRVAPVLLRPSLVSVGLVTAACTAVALFGWRRWRR